MTLTEREAADLAVLAAEDDHTYEEARGREPVAGPGAAPRRHAPPSHDYDGHRAAAAAVLRPLTVAVLSSGAAALMAGGIFGSWGARAVALFGAVAGVGWAYLALRSEKRRLVLQGIAPAVAFGLGMLSLVPTSGGPARMFALMGDAIGSGRILRPPVPFDPGWRPILIIGFFLAGMAAAWVATALARPQLALFMPLPVLFLTAISQPAEGEFVAGVVGFLPLLVAMALLFGGDTRASELSAAFELRRAVRAIPFVAGGAVLVIVMGNAQFLFPTSVYNPADKPQKPRAIPLGEVRDRVMFEVDGELTGPWKTGTLDVYDGESWRLAPFNSDRMVPVRDDGVVDGTRAGDVKVIITTRDLGTTSVVPGVPGPTKLVLPDGGPATVYDPRVGVFRVPQGSVPPDTTYEMWVPKFPDAAALQAAPPARNVDPEFLAAPNPPPAVRQLLAQAPDNPFDRLDFLRDQLNEVVVAAGAGSPAQPVPPRKVDDLLVGSHEGSPFEIVAAEALLARWAGIPSRIGYGFDGFNDEDGVRTVRPANGSNWLEAYFEGHGWVPLIGTPPRAKASLDTDPNARFDPNIAPGENVAVELYVPVELQDLRHLYQQIQAVVVMALPWVILAVAAYLGLPSARRALRRRRRMRWADEIGPRAVVGVAYAEFRDAATDLNVGDPNATPLEFLHHVVADREHTELAWLVTRALWGDLLDQVTAADAASASEMADSLRRRMYRVQPLQSRVLAALSRASLRSPYTLEIPTVRTWMPRRPKRPVLTRSRRHPHRRRRLRPRSHQSPSQRR